MADPTTPHEIYLDILTNDLDFSKLPEEALMFLTQYLTCSMAHSKVSILLGEIQRLHDRLDYDDYHEHVGYKPKKQANCP